MNYTKYTYLEDKNRSDTEIFSFPALKEVEVYHKKFAAGLINLCDEVECDISEIRKHNSNFWSKITFFETKKNSYFLNLTQLKLIKDELLEFEKFYINSENYLRCGYETLYRLYSDLEQKNHMIYEICNQKSNEIVSSRITITNLLLSITAICIATISII